MSAAGLELTLTANTAGFIQSLAQGDAAVNKAMSDMQTSVNRFAGVLDGLQTKARSSAAVFQEFDAAQAQFRALQGQLDPAARALHQFEAAQEAVARAVEAGAIEQAEANQVLNLSRIRYEASAEAARRAAAAQNGLEAATETTSRSFARMGGGMQQAGYQIGDFAVQVASGQNALIALTQQGTQLLGAFGPWGAVIGAAGAVVGALAVAFLGAGDEAETLEDKTKTLTDAVESYRSAVAEARLSTEDMRERYGSAADAVGRFTTALAEVGRVKAWEALGETLGDLSDQFDSLGNTSAQAFRMVASAMEPAIAGVELIKRLDETSMDLSDFEDLRDDLEGLSEIMGVTVGQAAELAAALVAMRDAEGPKAQTEAAAQFANEMLKAFGSVEKMNRPARDLYEQVVKIGREGAVLVGTMEDAGGTITRAASAAATLADELRDAMTSARNLSAGGLEASVRARINYDYRDDPIARAEAIARAEFDSQVEIPAGATPDAVEALDLEREAYVESAVEAARYEEKLRAVQAAQVEAGRAAKAGAKDTDQVAKATVKARQRLDEMIASRKAEAEAFGLTGEALTRHEAALDAAAIKQDLLNKAAAEGRALAPADVAAIDELSRAYVDLSVANEAQAETAAAAVEVQSALVDTFSSAVTQADSLEDAFKRITLAMVEMGLQGALLGEGPLASLFGGASGGSGGSSLFGMIGSAVLRGAVGGAFGGPDLTADPTPGLYGRALGGPVSAGRRYAINEHLHGGRQVETFVPSVNGAVLNVSQAQAAIRAASSSMRSAPEDPGSRPMPKITIINNGTTADVRATPDEVIIDTAVRRVGDEMEAPGSRLHRAAQGASGGSYYR